MHFDWFIIPHTAICKQLSLRRLTAAYFQHGGGNCCRQMPSLSPHVLRVVALDIICRQAMLGKQFLLAATRANPQYLGLALTGVRALGGMLRPVTSTSTAAAACSKPNVSGH